MDLLMGGAVVLALAIVAWRKWGPKPPRFVEDRDVRTVTGHREIDDVVATLRCACGGRYEREGEGPVKAAPSPRAGRGFVDASHAHVGEASLWRVVAACIRCERKRALVFRLAS